MSVALANPLLIQREVRAQYYADLLTGAIEAKRKNDIVKLITEAERTGLSAQEVFIVQSQESGYSPLYASYIHCKGKTDILTMLSSSFDLDLRGPLGNTTPLHIAVKKDSAAVLTFCTKKLRLTVNSRDSQGRAAVHEAILCEKKTMLELLLKTHNANANLKDNEGNTPMHLLMDPLVQNHEKKLNLLLQCGGNPNIKNDSGETPIHLLMRNYMEVACELLRMLLKNGGSMKEKNVAGETPVQVLHMTKHTARTTALLEVIGEFSLIPRVSITGSEVSISPFTTGRGSDFYDQNFNTLPRHKRNGSADDAAGLYATRWNTMGRNGPNKTKKTNSLLPPNSRWSNNSVLSSGSSVASSIDVLSEIDDESEDPIEMPESEEERLDMFRRSSLYRELSEESLDKQDSSDEDERPTRGSSDETGFEKNGYGARSSALRDDRDRSYGEDSEDFYGVYTEAHEVGVDGTSGDVLSSDEEIQLKREYGGKVNRTAGDGAEIEGEGEDESMDRKRGPSCRIKPKAMVKHQESRRDAIPMSSVMTNFRGRSSPVVTAPDADSNDKTRNLSTTSTVTSDLFDDVRERAISTVTMVDGATVNGHPVENATKIDGDPNSPSNIFDQIASLREGLALKSIKSLQLTTNLATIVSRLDERSLLHLAAAKGWTMVGHHLLDPSVTQAFIDPDSMVDISGATALHIAARDNKLPFARLLMGAGANALAIDENGETPASLSIEFGGHSSQVYMDRIDLTPAVAEKLLLRCFTTGNRVLADKVRKQFERDTGTHVENVIFQLAAKNTSWHLVQHIIKAWNRHKAGRNLDRRDADGFGAVHYVAYHGNLRVMRSLHEAGASLLRKSKNSEATTPLRIAAARGHSEVVTFINSVIAERRVSQENMDD